MTIKHHIHFHTVYAIVFTSEFPLRCIFEISTSVNLCMLKGLKIHLWVVVLRWIILAGINHIGGVVVSVLALSVVDRRFESRSTTNQRL